MAEYVLAIDQGTTSTRAILFDHDGLPAASGQLEHEQIFPRAGWVEHDPMEIWNNVREVIGQALAKADITRHDVKAVGITNQRETSVVWNKTTGQPVYNAIVWQDTRTQAIVDRRRRSRPFDRRSLQGEGRTTPRDLLRRDEDRVDPRERRRRPRGR